MKNRKDEVWESAQNAKIKTNGGPLPKLRFPEFRIIGDWLFLRGDEMFDPISNKDHNSDLPILAISQEFGAVPRDEIDYNVVVTDKSVGSYKVVEIGDFVISLRSFQGGIEYSEYRGICSPAYIILRKKDNSIANQFYKYYFKTVNYINELNKSIEGIRDGKMVSFAHFSEIKLPLPKHEEQRKIAACLSSLDSLLAAHSRKLEALMDYKKGLMQALFPAEGESVPKIRFPKFSYAGEWEIYKASSLLIKVSNPVEVKPNEIYKQIGIRSHGKGIFYKEPVTGQELGNKRVFWVEESAFIVNIVFAWEQAVAITSKEKHGMIASHRFPMYKARDNKCDVDFIKHFFLTRIGKALLGIASPGGAGRNKTLGQTEFDDLAFKVPIDVSEQQRIASTLSTLEDLIAAQVTQVEALKQHKRGLMQGLFPSPDKAD
jgi:type I restriction enzyme, S subunit